MHSDHQHHHHQVSAHLLWLAIALTFGYAAVEAAVGWWAGSLTLVADAGHMVNDAAALLLAALAMWLAARPPSLRHSYGLGRAEFLAALVNSLALLALVTWIVLAALQRLHSPQAVSGGAVSLTAALGLLLNLAVAWLLSRGAHNLNIRAALWHVLGDLLGSVAALLAGIVIMFSGWTPIDPLLSLAISVLIIVSSLRLVREALHGLLDGVPPTLAPHEVGQALATVPGVQSVHDLHIWSASSEQVLLTAHLVVSEMRDWESVLDRCQLLLRERFAIHHATLQPEPGLRRVQWRQRPDT